MVPVRTTGLIVARWVMDFLGSLRPRIRLSCRTAVWPTALQDAIRETYGSDSCAFAVLQPLSEEDVLAVAGYRGIPGDKFLRAVDAAGVRTLSEQPLTLEMLLNIHQAHGTFPKRRRELFSLAMEQLAGERRERTRDGTAVEIPTTQLLEAAERVACFTLLSGRDIVDLRDGPAASAIGTRELEALPAAVRSLDSQLLDTIGRSGVCEGDGSDRFRFAHRQFAEYLAGRRLAKLLPHQAQSLLGAGAAERDGAAGPLRETAAFAAMESEQIAAWLTKDDPEVIGLSDVADMHLRQQATLNLLTQCRTRKLTDSQFGRSGIELAGFQYPNAEKDLGPVLRERQEGCEDVIECAVELIESWGLASMSDDLATLVLDPAAPFQSRLSAAYLLAKVGDSSARARLLPLVAGAPNDRELDLKGLALRCNWPDRLSTPQILAAVAPRIGTGYYGAYEGFLHQLDNEGFDGVGHRLASLRWARQFVRSAGSLSTTNHFVGRIAAASLGEIDDPGIADALADLILDAAEAHARSPLSAPISISSEEEHGEPPVPALTVLVAVRRKLIDALAARAGKDQELWWAARNTPGLLAVDDFSWLVERAVCESRPMPVRANYADFARMLPWTESVECIEAWLKAKDSEPVSSRLNCPLSLELKSTEAAMARKQHAQMQRWREPTKPRPLRPPPAERVEQALSLCENRDPAYFRSLCLELTLQDDSREYQFSRFLTDTPGWASASPFTRQRVVGAAKQFLNTESSDAECAKTAPLSSILTGHMPAIWLVLEQDAGWLDDLPTTWWRRWAWYMLRELHPRMHGEAEGPKLELFRKLHRRVSKDVEKLLLTLATSDGADSRNQLTGLLGVMEDIEDAALDEELCAALEAGKVPEDRLGDVAGFVLGRSNERAIAACLTRIQPAEVTNSEASAVRTAVALLHEGTRSAWLRVFALLRGRGDIARRVLGDFAYSDCMPSCRAKGDDWTDRAESRADLMGELFALLLVNFPPESDPPTGGGARAVGPIEAARRLRDQLVSWLGDQRDFGAVETLRRLEAQYGKRYPWLRRPRARAERAYRLACWEPVAPAVVAQILVAKEKRLLRSGRDALDGVVAAVNSYASDLRRKSPSDLEDLWNRPRAGAPSPKEEERVSDKVCAAVREYFREFAVAANREVQVFRRTLSAALGGAPGSEVDVLVQVVPTGAVTGVEIQLPIEVKLAHNPEARSGLRDQLAERYMAQLGTGLGVYVVVWMGKGGKSSGYRSMWHSAEVARADLEEQARLIAASSSDLMDVRVIVIDASLPTIVNSPATSGPKRVPDRGARIVKRSTKRKKETGPDRTPGSSRRMAAKPRSPQRKGKQGGGMKSRKLRKRKGRIRPIAPKRRKRR